MASLGELEVTHLRTEVVTLAEPTQEHWLPASNLDLIIPSTDVGVFFCYKKPTSARFPTFTSVIGTLKSALAQALVHYFPFVGQLIHNFAGEPELHCNNGGVDFIEAKANLTLQELDLHKPDETVSGKLVPRRERGVLAVQATELRCGGIVVACTFDHGVADAYSANMFLASWAEIALSGTISMLPCFRRSLINPRRPGIVDATQDSMYLPMSPLPIKPSENPEEVGHVNDKVSRIYYILGEDLKELKRLASSDGNKKTKFESFSAFLWKVIAESAKSHERISKIGIVVDGRTRLRNDLEAYFGNVLSVPVGEMAIKDLADETLSSIANKVHDFLNTAKTEEHFLGLIDWVEARRPGTWLQKVYLEGGDEGPAIMVSSGQRFPVSKVDFGWGKPAFGSYYFPAGASPGYVMPMPSPLGNDDWVVYMSLSGEQVKFLEAEAGHIFRPLTSDYYYKADSDRPIKAAGRPAEYRLPAECSLGYFRPSCKWGWSAAGKMSVQSFRSFPRSHMGWPIQSGRSTIPNSLCLV